MKTTDAPVIVKQRFDKSPAEVWNAITAVDEMTHWYFENIPDFKPEVGFETQFLVSTENRDFLHLWKVTEVIPNKKITYNWKYKDLQGDSYVTFELAEIQSQTELTVTSKVVEDFDDSIAEFKRESCLEGWRYFINQRLKDYLSER